MSLEILFLLFVLYKNIWQCLGRGETLFCYYLFYLMIIWPPERVSDTVNLSVSHQLPGDLWEVTTSPCLILSK